METVQTVEEAVAILQDDRTNGARVLATNALRGLIAFLHSIPGDDASYSQLWHNLRVAGYKLTTARPSMASAITSAVTRALSAVRMEWSGLEQSRNTALMKWSAIRTIEHQIQDRGHSTERLADVFVEYLSRHGAAEESHLRILTLSSSSSLHACLCRAATTLTTVHFTIYVLESRPAMEGASFAAKLIESLNTNTKTENVNVIMGPDSHVCTFAKEIDVLLLGADRVSSEGDVSNKMGSLAAALGVKTLSKADVVVVSESDKIARPGGIRDHKEEDNDAEEVVSAWPQDVRRQLDTVVGDRLAFRNIYFEWIPKQFINTYVTEEGVLDADRIRAISEMKGRLEDELFDSSITNSAS